MKHYIVGFIFARGGSQGVPGKNIRLLGNKPLIAHAIEAGFQSELIDRVVVSTDDEKIAKVARDFGAEIPFMRPRELAQNNSPEWLAWQHAIRTMERLDKGRKLDVFVSIPPTAPLRTVQDIDNCIHTFLDNDIDVVITVKNASRHPSFNMVSIDANGFAILASPPSKTIYRRQDVSPMYDVLTAVYVANPQFILEATSIFDGKIKTVIVPEERAVDIDTEIDFQFAEYLMNKRMKQNEKN